MPSSPADELAERILARLSGNASDLPSLNAQAVQVMALSAKVMQADTTELEMLIRRDPAASADLLRAANSPMYRRNADVLSISDAIVRLGRQQVYSIVTAVAARNLFEENMRDLYALYPEEWHLQQNHCVASAFGAAWLAAKENWGSYDAAFLGGMFHDVGKIVALQSMGKIMLAGATDVKPGTAAFNAVIDQTHVRLGVEALKMWKLPAYLLEIAMGHHGEVQTTSPHFKLVTGIRLISCLDIIANDQLASPTVHVELLAARKALNLDDSATQVITEKLAVITEHAMQLMRSQ